MSERPMLAGSGRAPGFGNADGGLFGTVATALDSGSLMMPQDSGTSMDNAPALGLQPDAPTETMPSQAAANHEITFITGVKADGLLAGKTFWTWNGKNPAHYSQNVGSAHKWAGGPAGSSGGVVTYCFAPTSHWTPAEQTAWQGAFALWSAEANITFQQVDNPSQADVRLIRGSDGGAYEDDTYDKAAPGSQILPLTSNALISIDTSRGAFGSITSFANGAYGISTVVHEIGHLIGLGHGGPYNGNVNAATQQFGPLDSRLWSIMSYISPDDSSAKYYDQYPVTGTNWGNAEVSVTPQMLDILAAQRLYGMPTNTPLDGGQVFGFNTNITAAFAPVFNFSINTHPVVTLWDAGGNNTLDISGFKQAATVNLNPGTFSSVDGMTNNIGIAYGTKIDTVIGGSGNDSFTVNADNDTINGGGGLNTVIFNAPQSDYTIHEQNTVTVADNVRTGAVDALTNIHALDFTNGTVIIDHTGDDASPMISSQTVDTGSTVAFLGNASPASDSLSAPPAFSNGSGWLVALAAPANHVTPPGPAAPSLSPIGGSGDLAFVLHEQLPQLLGVAAHMAA